MRILTLFMLVYLMSCPLVKAQYNYAEALQKSMFFYEVQQSGELNSTNRVTWRANSALDDGSDVGLDLTGGWYDAGDHVKFGFPMAFSATMLAWGGVDFPEGYEDNGQMEHLKNNLKWVNDYFIKCHTAPNEFYGQVGNGGADHAWWGSAEVMQMARPSYKIDAANPGSDLAAETAAAMAASSMVFADSDPAYAATLLSHATQLYDFADNYRGVYSDAITDAGGYYRSFSGYNDELVWGAIWLYRATGDEAYLTKAKTYYANLSNEGQSGAKSYKWGIAWDDKAYGCYALMAKITGEAEYKTDIERHLDYWTDGYNGERINYTPGGLAYLDVWGALRYSINTSFLALYYYNDATTSSKGDKYYNFAIAQANYALGDNPRNSSYVCGFGTNPPLNPHHRTAHGCWSNNQNGPPEVTRHTLYGALVGGPNSDDTYEDERSNYVNNEVATDYNAAFSGVMSKLSSDIGGSALSNFPVAETPTDEFFTEAKLNAEGGTHSEYAVWVYNHSAWPARIADSYAFRLFIDISEGIAAGYSASDYVVSTNNAGVASFTDLQPWDASSNIYYTEVTLNSDIFLWPGGQGESRKEVQMRVRLPYEAPTSAWDPTNDWSYQDLGSSLIQTPHIPLYVDGELAFGSEPTAGEPVDVTGVQLSPLSGEIKINENIQLTASVMPANASDKSVTWTSSNPAVATVNSAGLVSGISAGSAEITVTTNDGGYTSTASIIVTDEVAEQFTITTSVTGSGSISLNPAGGTYDEGTLVTITATAAAGFLFDNWTGDVATSTNPIVVTVTADMEVIANFIESTNTGDCENPTEVSLPLAQDGVGEFCYVTSDDISFVNSWNLDELTINGVDFTNTWSNTMPAKIDGYYYIHYVGPFGWSHAEINSASSARKAHEVSTAFDVFPNPTSNEITIKGASDFDHLTIMSLSGQVMQQQSLSGANQITISVANLKPGIYLLKAQGNDKQMVRSLKVK